jgi:hypothetical protein
MYDIVCTTQRLNSVYGARAMSMDWTCQLQRWMMVLVSILLLYTTPKVLDDALHFIAGYQMRGGACWTGWTLIPPSSTTAQPSSYTQVMAPSDPLRFHHKTDMAMTVTRAGMYCSLGHVTRSWI